MGKINFLIKLLFIAIVLFWNAGNALAIQLQYFNQISEMNYASATINDGTNYVFDEDLRTDGSVAYASVAIPALNYWRDSSIGQAEHESGDTWAWLRALAGSEGIHEGPGFPYSITSSSEAVYEFFVESPVEDYTLMSLGAFGYYAGYDHTLTISDQDDNEIFSYSWGLPGTTFLDHSIILDTNTAYFLSYSFSQNNIFAYDASGDLVVEFDSAPVPEPATLFLLGTGLAGIFGFRKRKSQC